MKKSQLLKNILVHRISLSHYLSIYLSIYRSPVSSLFSLLPFPPRGRFPLRMQILLHFVNKHHERFKGKLSTNIHAHLHLLLRNNRRCSETEKTPKRPGSPRHVRWLAHFEHDFRHSFPLGHVCLSLASFFLNIPSRDFAYHSFSVSSSTVLTSRCSCKLLLFCIY